MKRQPSPLEPDPDEDPEPDEEEQPDPLLEGFSRFRAGARARDQAAREAPSRQELAEAVAAVRRA